MPTLPNLSPAAIATLFGYASDAPVWQMDETRPAIPVALWGKDHWSTFAYIETRIVDHGGMLLHDHMRCDANRHPILYSAKRVGLDAPGKQYPTRCKEHITPDQDDQFGTWEVHDHDDYDCQLHKFPPSHFLLKEKTAEISGDQNRVGDQR